MAFSIKNEEADRLARQLAAITGENLTETVVRALRERLGRQKSPAGRCGAGSQLAKLGKRFARLPVLDSRSADDILGYDRDGLPR